MVEATPPTQTSCGQPVPPSALWLHLSGLQAPEKGEGEQL